MIRDLIEIIHEHRFKNPSRILKIFKNESFKVSVASIPKVVSTMNRHLILDTKKRSACISHGC
jgi:hypothetical protein